MVYLETLAKESNETTRTGPVGDKVKSWDTRTKCSINSPNSKDTNMSDD